MSKFVFFCPFDMVKFAFIESDTKIEMPNHCNISQFFCKKMLCDLKKCLTFVHY